MVKRLEFTLSQRLFDELNEEVKIQSGSDLASLANNNPRHAYQLLQALKDGIISGAIAVRLGNETVATEEMDGAQATRGLARYINSQNEQPDIDIEPVEVCVKVYRHPNDNETHIGTNSTDTVIDFRTQPPNLTT